MGLASKSYKVNMNLPKLRPLCSMPRPKIIRTSWNLKGRLQYILANRLLQEREKTNNEMKKEEPKGDEYIVSPCLRQKVENL